ncbi:response regulator transcription factor [Chitinimonas sp. PSY-7]|uniref:LuxR C-terminal-related transcriptional regulator n=1 Tax=Chitinimonas sp. PSY-7 TaxID=3459088 RepID=UPI00403FD967
MSLDNLTRKQHEILKLSATGLNSPQMAKQLGCSHKTVRNQLSMIYAKLGVSNRVQAVVLYSMNTYRDS